MYLQTFKGKPPECETRLREVVALGGNAETLAQAYPAWQGLVQDLKSLTQDPINKISTNAHTGSI
jgi:hypothetical protein